MRRVLASLVLVAAMLGSAQAESLGCTPAASVSWREGIPSIHDYPEAEFGPVVFGLDLETGRYEEHLIGGRAGVSGGGTLEIIEAAEAGRHQDFVGVDREDGSLFRISLADGNIAFIRTHRSGEVDIGTCVPGGVRDAVEGYPR